MLNKATTLKGYTLHSLDGEIGRVKEFYFDDRHWTIRYLVADTGNWLSGRQVLISPHALGSVMSQEQSIAVNLTRQQIEGSPSLDSDKPVSRQYEQMYYRHYGWPLYWGGPYMWGTSGYPGIMPDIGLVRPSSQGGLIDYDSLGAPPVFEQTADTLRDSTEAKSTGDPYLRSINNVRGHQIQATDGSIGHIDDYIIDDETWAIRYLIVDTVNWWPGKKVLVAARWIERVSWDDSKVFINLSRAAIKQSPEYTDESLLTRDYEIRLHQHYERQGYWG
jgi:hypothetical protein